MSSIENNVTFENKITTTDSYVNGLPTFSIAGTPTRSVIDDSYFKREYLLHTDNDYDRPIITKELNNDKVMLYEAWGIPKENITYKTEFINKTKQTYLNVVGKNEMTELCFENDINIHLLIDTDVYDGYEVNIDDGMIMIILHEIKNEAPILKDCTIL